MTLLTKDALFASSTPKHEDVIVPGGAIRIAMISAAGRDLLVNSGNDDAPLSEFQARMVAATAIDEQGDLLFGVDDVQRLRRLPPETLNVLAETAARINGIGQAAVEDAEKNFGAAPSGALQSDSPSLTAFP